MNKPWRPHRALLAGASLCVGLGMAAAHAEGGSAYRDGQYVSANLLWTPNKFILMGAEYLWGLREDKSGARGEDNRIQLSFKFSFDSDDLR